MAKNLLPSDASITCEAPAAGPAPVRAPVTRQVSPHAIHHVAHPVSKAIKVKTKAKAVTAKRKAADCDDDIPLNAAYEPARQPVGKVAGVWGTVFVKNANGDVHLLQVGETVNPGDVIITAQNGYVMLEGEGSRLARIPAAEPLALADNGAIDIEPAAGLTGGDAGGLLPGERVSPLDSTIAPQPAYLISPFSPTALNIPENTVNQTPTASALAVPTSTVFSDGNETRTTTEDTAISGNLFDNAVNQTSTTSTAVLAYSIQGMVDEVFLPGQTTTIPGVGTLSVAANGDYTFTPAANWSGTVPRVTYQLQDGTSVETSTLDITVTAVVDPFTDANESVSTPEDTARSGDLLENKSSIEGAITVTTFSIAGQDGTFAAGQTATIAGGVGTIVINADGTYTFTPAANWNGTVPQISYVTSDTQSTDISTLDITVDPTDDAPSIVAEDNNGGTAANGQVTVYEAGLNNAGDTSEVKTGQIQVSAPDGLGSITIGTQVITAAELQNLTQTPISITSPGKGILKLTSFENGLLSYEYTLTTAQAHPGHVNSELDAVYDTLALTVTDTDGDSSTGTFSIQIVDDLPTAAPDTNEVTEAARSVTGNVLTDNPDRVGNDANATPVTAGNPIVGQYGNLVLNADGTYTYTLHSGVDALQGGASANDVFNYTITDADGDVATTTLTIKVTATDNVPTINPDDLNGGANGQVTVYEAGLNSASDSSEVQTGQIQVSALDGLGSIAIGTQVITAAELQNLAQTPISITSPGKGILKLTSFENGVLNYEYTLTTAQAHPGHVNSELDAVYDTLALTVTDTDGDSSTGTFSIQIVDALPTTIDDGTAVLSEAQARTGVTVNVLANDTFGGDGARATTPVTTVTSLTGQYGTFTLNADNTYTYNLTSNLLEGQTIRDTVNYQITDADGDVATATLAVNVVGDKNVPSVVVIDGNGTASGQATVYEHGLNNSGDARESTTGVLTLTAEDGLQSVSIGGQTISAADLANLSATNYRIDTDKGYLLLTSFDGSRLAYTYVLTTAQSHSSSSDEVYDDFAVTVTDINGDVSPTATFRVTIIDDVPTATNDGRFSIVDGQATSINIPILANDSYGGDGASTAPAEAVSFTTLTGLYGSLTRQADGSYTYTLDNARLMNVAPAVYTEDFTYQIADADGDTATAHVLVDVTVTNTPPVAVDDTYTMAEDAPPITLTPLALDTDPDSSGLIVTSINGIVLTPGTPQTITVTNGTVSVGATGVITFAPAANYFGTVSFPYTISDGQGGTATANEIITITSVNDGPVAVNDLYTMAEDAPPITLTPLALDSDIDGGTLSITSINGIALTPGTAQTIAVTNGTVNVNAAGAITFTPAANYFGTVSFPYIISDGQGGTATANEIITITSVNDGPVAVDDTYTMAEDAPPITLTPLALDSDVDGGTLSVTSINGTVLTPGTAQTIAVNNGTVSVSATGVITFAPAANYFGTVTFPYTISDGQGGTATANEIITITSVNDGPVAVNDLYTMAEDAPPITLTPLALDSDVDGGTLSVTSINGIVLTPGTAQTITVENGTVNVSVAGVITFAPVANYFGTVTFPYTISDGQGGTATANEIITITSVNDVPVITVQTPDLYVSEEGLVGGIVDDLGYYAGTPAKSYNGLAYDGDVTNSVTSSGTFSVADIDSTNVTVRLTQPDTEVRSGGDLVRWEANADGTALTGWVYSSDSTGRVDVATMALTSNGDGTYGYTFTLLAPLDQANTAGEDTLTLNFQAQASDGTGSATPVTLSVTVEDDAPYSIDKQSVTVSQTNTNLVLTLDVSESMAELVPFTDQQTRLDIAVASLKNLIQSYDDAGNVSVYLTLFDSTLLDSTAFSWLGDWMSASEALSALTELANSDIYNQDTNRDTGWTNYHAALAGATAAINSAPVGNGVETVSYFISDGAPNITSTGEIDYGYTTDSLLSTAEQTAWQTLVSTHDVLSYAIGVAASSSTGASTRFVTALDPLAYDGVSGTDRTPEMVANLVDLDAFLQSTLPTHSTGDLISNGFNEGFGADGGHLYSVTVNGTTYGIHAWITGTATPPTDVFNATTGILTVTTGEGGTFAVNVMTGAYTYTAPADLSYVREDTVRYELIDNDGDHPAGSILAFQLGTPTVVTHQGTAGEDTLTGTSGADYIVGGKEQDILNGGAGNDVLQGDSQNETDPLTVGGSASDWLASANDTLSGGAGNDTLIGGFGSDTFAWHLGDASTTAVPATDIVTDFTTGGDFKDVLDLRDLLQVPAGEAYTAVNLDKYLDFGTTTDGSTAINVHSTGNADVVDQVIVLSGVDLAGALGVQGDQAIITAMLNQKTLLVDPASGV